MGNLFKNHNSSVVLNKDMPLLYNNAGYATFIYQSYKWQIKIIENLDNK